MSSEWCVSTCRLLLGLPVGLADYEAYDPDDRRPRDVLEADADTLEMLDLTFTYDVFDQARTRLLATVPLVKRGDDIVVTVDNRRRYLGKWCRYRMLGQVSSAGSFECRLINGEGWEGCSTLSTLHAVLLRTKRAGRATAR